MVWFVRFHCYVLKETSGLPDPCYNVDILYLKWLQSNLVGRLFDSLDRMTPCVDFEHANTTAYALPAEPDDRQEQLTLYFMFSGSQWRLEVRVVLDA
jgi:hypothetical protein